MYFVPTATENRIPVPQKGSAAQTVETGKSPKHFASFYTTAPDQFVGKDKQTRAETGIKPPEPGKQPTGAPPNPAPSPERAGANTFPKPGLKPDVIPGKPDSNKAETGKKHKQGAQPTPETSKTVGTFKIGYSLIAGFINSYLFGTPVWVAGGLSALFAGTQALMAMKIEREDTETAKKVLHLSRKITRTEHDKSAGAKERAMAPVWGSIAAGLALIESGFNDIYERYNSKPQKTIVQIIQDVETQIRNASSWMKPLHKFQLNGLKFRQELENGVPRQGMPLFKQWLAKAWNYSSRHIKGNKPLAYACSAISSFIGGFIQIHMAAQLQDGIEKHKFWSKRQGPA